MFTTLKQRILLGIYIFIIISIPVGAYLASQATQLKSKASEPSSTKTITQKPKTATSSSQYLDRLSSIFGSNSTPQSNQNPTSAPNTQSTTLATSFGPTLTLKALIDGRPASNQATKLFVGIISGTSLTNPQYLLSFYVDLPASGEFSNLSLAGLTVGNTYSAILKGDAQIATSSAFVMSPSVTNLNSSLPLTMLSGDLNQDNVINNLDYQIAQAALGSTPTSTKWNITADLNKDGVVNGIDLGIINKNIGKVGASGSWVSTPHAATPSGSIAEDGIGSPGDSPTSGYWVWVPK